MWYFSKKYSSIICTFIIFLRHGILYKNVKFVCKFINLFIGKYSRLFFSGLKTSIDLSSLTIISEKDISEWYEIMKYYHIFIVFHNHYKYKYQILIFYMIYMMMNMVYAKKY